MYGLTDIRRMNSAAVPTVQEVQLAPHVVSEYMEARISAYEQYNRGEYTMMELRTELKELQATYE